MKKIFTLIMGVMFASFACSDGGKDDIFYFSPGSIGLLTYSEDLSKITPTAAKTMVRTSHWDSPADGWNYSIPGSVLSKVYNPNDGFSIPWNVNFFDNQILSINDLVADDLTLNSGMNPDPNGAAQEYTINTTTGVTSPAILGAVAVEFKADNTPVMSSTIPATHVVEPVIPTKLSWKTAFSKDSVYERILLYYNKNYKNESNDSAIFYGIKNKTTNMVYISYVFAKKYLDGAPNPSDRGKLVKWRSEILLNPATTEFSYKWGSNPIIGSGSIIGGGAKNTAFLLRFRGWKDATDISSVSGDEWHVIDPSFNNVVGEGVEGGSIPDDLIGTPLWNSTYNYLAPYAKATKFYNPTLDYPADILNSW